MDKLQWERAVAQNSLFLGSAGKCVVLLPIPTVLKSDCSA
jgi:hypothetical protein